MGTVLHAREIATISTDRRRTLRVEVQLPVRYEVVADTGGAATGCTLDISRHGVAIRISETLPVGSYMYLSIDWPDLLGRLTGVKLHLSGRVMRSDTERTVIRIDTYRFGAVTLRIYANTFRLELYSIFSWGHRPRCR